MSINKSSKAPNSRVLY